MKARAAVLIALAASLVGCELVVDFDRSKIGRDGGSGEGGMIDGDIDAGADAGEARSDAGLDGQVVDAQMDAAPLDGDTPDGASDGDIGDGHMGDGDVGDGAPADAATDGGPTDGAITDGSTPDGGCVSNAQCNDGNECTRNICNMTSGQCSYPAIDCNDNNPCTADSCDMSTGCVYNQSARNGMACDDGEYCTNNTTCMAGACGGGDPTCADSDECTIDLCESSSMTCTHVALTQSLLSLGFGSGTAGADQVRLRNPAAAPVDFGGYYLCSSSASTGATVRCHMIAAGTTAAASGAVVVNSTMLGFELTDGELALAAADAGTDVCDYVQWGSGNHQLATTTGSQWTAPGAFVPAMTLMSGGSIGWDPTMSTDNDGPTEWSVGTSF